MKMWLAGWEGSNGGDKHEVEFDTRASCRQYLRQELAWLAVDLSTSDPMGDKAMDVARTLLEEYPGGGNWEEVVDGYLYFIRKNPKAVAAGKAGA